MIDKTVLLGCSLQRAFELFTERTSDWWPADRRHTKDPRSEIFLLPNGRFFERARDGREVDLGRVRVWDPPRRLLLDFYIGTDADHPTEVLITFAEQGDSTRVRVEHRPTERSRDLWEKRAPAYVRSWDLVLAAFRSAASP